MKIFYIIHIGIIIVVQLSATQDERARVYITLLPTPRFFSLSHSLSLYDNLFRGITSILFLKKKKKLNARDRLTARDLKKYIYSTCAGGQNDNNKILVMLQTQYVRVDQSKIIREGGGGR